MPKFVSSGAAWGLLASGRWVPHQAQEQSERGADLLLEGDVSVTNMPAMKPDPCFEGATVV